MPFRHADRSHDLATRIDLEVRERLEEAVDFVCLEALVRTRQQRGLPPPAADNVADRRDYTAHVSVFLDLLLRELTVDLTAEQQRRVGGATVGSGDAQAQRVAVQVILARMLPDYWQRFDAIRARYLAEPALPISGASPDAQSRSEGRGLLGRLFGRG